MPRREIGGRPTPDSPAPAPERLGPLAAQSGQRLKAQVGEKGGAGLDEQVTPRGWSGPGAGPSDPLCCREIPVE